MPRRSGRRKKKRNHKPEEEISEAEKRRTPRCFVIKQGSVGEKIKDLVHDFREVMLPNVALKLKESRFNRLEDFVAVAGHFYVSHVIIFSSTKLANYMKVTKLPQGPTLTFRIMSFSLKRDVKASQKRPRSEGNDRLSAPLQVLNGFAGGEDEKKVTAKKLSAEMLRGLFPAIDVPNFRQTDCRRTALFHHDRETDLVHFRHYQVVSRPAGLQRGVTKLLQTRRVLRLGGQEDIADFVMGGGVGASESEVEEVAEAPVPGGGRIAVRLTELGPRLSLLLVKAEESICGGAVLYHRYVTKTPSQRELLEQKARQKQKLRARNKLLEELAKQRGPQAKKARKEEARQRDDGDDGGDGGEDGDGLLDSGDEAAARLASKPAEGRKGRRFHPFARGAKGRTPSGGAKDARGAGKDRAASPSKPGKPAKGAGKGKAGKGKGSGKGRLDVLSKFHASRKEPGR